MRHPTANGLRTLYQGYSKNPNAIALGTTTHHPTGGREAVLTPKPNEESAIAPPQPLSKEIQPVQMLFIQNNAYSIAIDKISDIDWTNVENNEITVTMESGNDYALDGEDYKNFLQLTGIIPPAN